MFRFGVWTAVVLAVGLLASGVLSDTAPGAGVRPDQAARVTGGGISAPDHSGYPGPDFTTVCADAWFDGCGSDDENPIWCGTRDLYNVGGNGTRGLTLTTFCQQMSCNVGSANCGAPKRHDCT
jgi:hypothetical protein